MSGDINERNMKFFYNSKEINFNRILRSFQQRIEVILIENLFKDTYNRRIILSTKMDDGH